MTKIFPYRIVSDYINTLPSFLLISNALPLCAEREMEVIIKSKSSFFIMDSTIMNYKNRKIRDKKNRLFLAEITGIFGKSNFLHLLMYANTD
jgi:hypothetical protein